MFTDYVKISVKSGNGCICEGKYHRTGGSAWYQEEDRDSGGKE